MHASPLVRHGRASTLVRAAAAAAVVMALSAASVTVATPRAAAAGTAGPVRTDNGGSGGTVDCVSEISGVQYNVSASLGGEVSLGGFEPDTLTGTCTLSGDNPTGGEVIVTSGLTELVAVSGFENDGTIAFEGDDLPMADTGTFDNTGTLIDEAPGYSQSVPISDFVNTGTVEAVEPSGASEGPTLYLVDGTSGSSANEFDDQGTVIAGSGGAIDVENGTFVLEPTGTVTAGPGSFGIGGGGTFDVQGGTVSGGDVAEDAFLGTCIQAIEFGTSVPAGSTGTIAGTCPVALSGTVAQGWTLDAGASVTAAPGAGNAGAIVLDDDDSTFSSTGTFTNTGTFADDSGGFTQDLAVRDFVNDGTVSAAEPTGATAGPSFGIADGSGDVFENDGTLSAGASSTVSVNGGTLQLDEGSSTVAGPGSLGLGTGGALVVDGGVVTGGSIQTFEFLGSCASAITFAGDVPDDSTGTIDNICPITLSGTIPSGWTLSTTSSITASPGAANEGTIELSGSDELSDSGSFGDTGLIVASGGYASIDAASFTCAGGGEVEVQSDQLSFAVAPTNLAAGTLSGCTWVTVGRLYLDGAVTTLDADVTEDAGGQVLYGSADALSSVTTIGPDGALRELGGSQLSVTGSLLDGGVIDLASTSSLTVPGTLDETASASLHTAIDGTSVGTIEVGGAATIGGDLDVTVDAGGAPTLGTTLDAVTASTTTGAFSTEELAALNSPDFIWVAYPATAVELQVVDEPQSTVTLGTSGSPVEFGVSVTLTASVTSSDGGTVAFDDGDTPIPGCTAQPVTAGAATCVVDDEAVGSHPLTAAYSGTAGVAGSTSRVLVEVVDPDATSTSVGTSDTPSPLGAPITFAATVTDSDGGGSVAFYDGGSVIPGCATEPLDGTTATCEDDDASLGSHSITAAYSGDTDSSASTSAALAQSVDVVTAVLDASTGGASGPIDGGDTLTVTGSGFSGATEVDFVDAACAPDAGTVTASVPASQFVVGDSGTTITLVAPSELIDEPNACAGVGVVTDVVVASTTDPSQLAVAPPDDEYTFTIPVVAGVTDAATGSAQGPLLGGEQLTIAGTGFTGATSVQFVDSSCTPDAGTTTASVPGTALDVSADGTSITLTSPGDPLDTQDACPGTAGIVTDVVVTVGSGPDAVESQVSGADAFTFELPIVAGVVDTDSTFQGGPIVGGNELVVYGSGLTGATKVEFVLDGRVVATEPTSGGSDSGVAITAPNLTSLAGLIPRGQSALATQLYVEIPDAHAPGGLLQSGASPYDGLAFETPVVTSVRTSTGSLTHGPLSGGESLVVHGTGLLGTLDVAFTYVDSKGTVQAVTVPATSNTEDGTTLTVTAPDLQSLVGLAGPTGITVARSELDVESQLRIVQVNPTTSQRYEGSASAPGDEFAFTVPARHEPAFTSASKTSGTKKEPFSFTVTTSGWPNATIKIGSHPSWLKLDSLGNGTATLTGTPTKATTVTVTVTASNGVGDKATQHLKIVVAA